MFCPKKPSTTQVQIYILLGGTRIYKNLYSIKKNRNITTLSNDTAATTDYYYYYFSFMCWPIYVRPTIIIMRQACGSNKEKLKIKFHANKESLAQVATVSS